MNEDFKQQAKKESEGKVLALGGRICDWLPVLETVAVRTATEVRGRMSVLNALINISFKAPVEIIRDWIGAQDLRAFLSAEETQLLAKEDDELKEQELINLRWSLESLWAMMWATRMVQELPATEWCGDNMASLLPNLEAGDDNTKLARVASVRPAEELYQMLDYYYRLHWYCVDERLHQREPLVPESLVYERRKALEWIFNRSQDWDAIEMGT